MTRRPMCLSCLFLILCFYFAEWMGFHVITGNPISKRTQDWIESHPDAEVYGMIDQCEKTDYGKSVYLKNAYLIYNSKKLPIKNIKAYMETDSQAEAGMYCLLSGKLERIPAVRNPGEFDSRQYYACRQIYYYLKKANVIKISAPVDLVSAYRAKVKGYCQKIYQKIAGEDASVFDAIILGDKTGLDDELKIRFQMAGIMHLLSISGMHLGIIALGLFAVLQRMGLGIWSAGIFSMAVMLGYGILTGGSSAILRAMCMFVLMMIARITGRIYDMMTGLSLAAMLLLLEAPAYLYSSSFWLSFSAVIGLGVIAPVLYSLTKNKITKKLIPGISIQLAMLPVLLQSYGEISLVGMFLNLLILPTAGVLVGSGILALGVGMIVPEAAEILIYPGRLLLHLYEWLSELCTGNSLAVWIVGTPKAWQILGYILLLASALGVLSVNLDALTSILLNRKRKAERSRKKKMGGSHLPVKIQRKSIIAQLLPERSILCIRNSMGFFIVIIAIVILTVRYHPNLRITCLDIGQGDCIVVEVPDGQCYLIDGGSSNKKNIGQYQMIPFLKNRGISEVDAIFISHTDEDHISGVREMMEMIQKGLLNIKIRRVVLPELTDPPDTYLNLVETVKKANIKIEYAIQGDKVNAGSVTWEVLSPHNGADGRDINENAMVLRLQYGSFLAMFTGDIGIDTEKKILERCVDVDFLKVGHHGSKNSSGEEFLNCIKPEVAAISCSATNRYGHPAPETIERLENVGARILRTDQMGAIEFETSG